MVAPNLRAFLYTWGPGRVTGEGEHIPVRMEPLQISDPNDLLLLLPVTAEHTIDERSPLFGHTHESLTVSASAEGIHVQEAGLASDWPCSNTSAMPRPSL